jgi:hypothetical protein
MLNSEREGKVSASAFAFNDVSSTFREATARTFIVTLITPKQFAATDPTKTGGVLEEPTPATER